MNPESATANENIPSRPELPASRSSDVHSHRHQPSHLDVLLHVGLGHVVAVLVLDPGAHLQVERLPVVVHTDVPGGRGGADAGVQQLLAARRHLEMSTTVQLESHCSVILRR